MTMSILLSMYIMTDSSRRGGARVGAGRHSTNRTCTLYIRISPEALDRLNCLTNNKSEFIDKLILNL